MLRSRTSFDTDWAIHVGNDILQPRRVLAKGGTANGWSDLTKDELEAVGGNKTNVELFGHAFQVVKLRPSKEDAAWQPVQLPHDWRISKKPAPDHPEAPDYPRSWQGFFPTGTAYYRKLFSSKGLQGKQTSITFDGIAGFTDIWFNGFWVGQQCTSYSPVSIDVSELLRPELEGPNVLLVRSDCSEAEGWWYEGGGIYRHVWLETHGVVHVARDGVHIRTPTITSDLAQVLVAVEVENQGSDSSSIILEVIINEPGGREVARTQSPHSVMVSSYNLVTVTTETSVANPQLWQIGDGRLYHLTTRIVNESGNVLDSVTSTFGFREIKWVEDGILVNGQWSKVHGVNLHQDWSVYGVALPDRVVEAKLELCVEMGVNTIRSAHHPPTPEFVAHADRLGILVVPENRLLSSSSFTIDHLRGLVRRFRNQPSVLLWSLENEEMDYQGTGMGRAIIGRLVKEVAALDPDRGTIVGGVIDLEDDYHKVPSVMGMHYRCFFGVLDTAVTYAPGKPILLDEEGLYASTRGVYEYDKENARPGSFSTLLDVMMDNPNPASNAALMPLDAKITGNVAQNLTTAFTHPKVSGSCIWAGLDYIGEPTPQRWPATTSGYGAKDLCGLPKDYYWLIRSIFRPEPLVHAFRHWTWPNKEGQQIPMRVYTNCDSVEFVLNGTVVARQQVTGNYVDMENGITYQLGELIARGYRDSQIVAEHRQVTTGKPSGLQLEADRRQLNTSGADVGFVRVAVVDNEGNLITDASHEIKFEVEGAGHLVGSHNADPSTDVYDAKFTATAFNGFVGVFVAAGTTSGHITLTASAQGLQVASIMIDVCESEVSHGIYKAADEADNKLFGVHTSNPKNESAL
ncbi:hypothetical protein V500_09027 [Pseudogymnoascus sp. VKM F-4518 (FW-2643)]|nr:hypothetical protein V500_09027 [Pseudogymnoascus sp. VKM F-4518 (FW-2643)]